MDGGQHAVAGAGRLLRRVCLGGAHLAHADDIGVIPQGHVQQHILVDVLLGVLALTGEGVDDAVTHPSVLLPHQIQLTGAVLNGEDAFIVRDGGQEPPRHRGLAGTSGPGHADGNTVPQAGGQKIQHGASGRAALHKVLLLHILRVDDTDGGGNAHILVHQRGFEDSDADVFGEVAQDGGAGVVQHHAADMEHAADHIDGVFRAVEVLLQLDRFPVGVQYLNVPPGVHIDLLDAGPEDVLGEQTKLSHLRVEGVHQLGAGIALDRDAPVLHIFGDVPLDLGLGVLIAALGDKSGILAGDILLHILQDGVEVLSLILRGEEEGVRPVTTCRFRVQGTPGEFFRYIHMVCGIRSTPCLIISCDMLQRLIRGLEFPCAGPMLTLLRITAYRAVRAKIEGEFLFLSVRACGDMRRGRFPRRCLGSEQGLISFLT